MLIKIKPKTMTSQPIPHMQAKKSQSFIPPMLHVPERYYDKNHLNTMQPITSCEELACSKPYSNECAYPNNIQNHNMLTRPLTIYAYKKK